MAGASGVIIASQFGDQANALIASLLPGAEIRPIPLGFDAPELLEADVFLHLPDVRSGAGRPDAPPPGWPGRLRMIQVISTGMEFYPGWLFSGPPVTTALGLAGPVISEYCLAAIFTVARDFPHVWMKGPEDWKRLSSALVSGSRLGIYGFGSIGRTLAVKALALGMRVTAMRGSDAPLDMDGVEQARDIGALIEASDHLVLAAPGTVETRHVINRIALARARPGLHLINVARGSLIDDEALLAALEDGTVGRATLDVTDPEPLPAGHPFYGHPRVFLSPHIANSGPAFLESVNRRAVENIKRLYAGEELVGLAPAD